MSSYAQWSGLALQMAILVMAGYFLGNWLDKLTGRNDTLFTLIAVVTGVIAAMLIAIRMIVKKTRNH